jgi:hypothetical protein
MVGAKELQDEREIAAHDSVMKNEAITLLPLS